MSKKEDLIACFEDTLKVSEKIKYDVKSKVNVYPENFVSKKKPKNYSGTISVVRNDTFEEARKQTGSGKIAVLNFANPHIPGGGVKNGTTAQEESLCRCSNLYLSLNTESNLKKYYSYNQAAGDMFFTDRIIYSGNITVFKNQELKNLDKKDWFTVDVVTCAAPYLARMKYVNKAVLFEVFKKRIRNIFEVSIDNSADVLILGAFGCGAFKNPPEIVAKAFKEVIEENEYKKSFKKIIFAIKTDKNKEDVNFASFDREFGNESTLNQQIFNLPQIVLPNYKTIEGVCVGADKATDFIKNEEINALVSEGVLLPLPQSTEEEIECYKEQQKFLKWKINNPYYGKQFSILGDSISTLEGYNPKGYNVFFTEENCQKAGICNMQDTWWGKVIDIFGGELLVNNSWSGSRVTKLPNRESLFPSGCSDERTSTLHINDVRPDVIIVYLGTNDWAFGARTGKDTIILGEDENDLFDWAYSHMLKKIKSNYPESEIWCCTLCETYMSKRPDFKFPHKHAGIHIEEYNEIIRDVTNRNSCRLIDLYAYKMAYDSVDGSHPTKDGMNTIATLIIRSIAGSEADQFLDCADEQHDYKVAEEYTGGTIYVCSHCGKMLNKINLPPIKCPEYHHDYEVCKQDGHSPYFKCRKCGDIKYISPMEGSTVENDTKSNNETEYVMFDPNITTILYSDILKLTVKSTGKTAEFQKDVVEVGRDQTCDLLLGDKPTVARHQATFFHERNIWFLRDNFSTNGTWINGAKIQPGKKYQLAANDEINFAMGESVIFDKHEPLQLAGDPDVEALAFLETGMATFAKSDQKDIVALKLIIAALPDAPLYFPVEIDLEAMLGSVDPTKLKPGDTLQPDKDVKMHILTLTSESGIEFVPMFTSNDEANKGLSTSIIRFYPQDYMPKLQQMDKPVIINPFSENRFLLSKQLITDILLPMVETKATLKTDITEQPADKFVGKIIDDKYEVLKLIGKGGFYATYLVRNIHINKEWAMKVCDKKNRLYSPAIRDSILREPHMMKKFDHPAIPNVVDIIENEEGIFVVREFINGDSLETIVNTHGAQPADKVIEWGKQLCSVLGYLHYQTPPHIYRDMKPANVILGPDGILKIIDFGIMRTNKPNQISDTCCLGTKGYAAPEQFGGSQTDARTDIYGLGMTMFRLVTGINPIEPPYETKPICSVNPNLPKGLEYIIIKCTQPDPNERYQSCNELMEDLNNYQSLPKSKGILSKLFGKK